MATTVFGTPITNETLRTFPEYVNETRLTQWDRARVAFQLKNAQDKDTNARKFAEQLRTEYKEGTACLIYNAIGARAQLVAYQDFTAGQLALSPFPMFIENGQWGVFLHGRFGRTASIGAVVYEAYNADGFKCQWLLSWKNPLNPAQPSVAYTDIRNCTENKFTLDTSKEKWDEAIVGPVINRNTSAMLSITEDIGCRAFASIGATTTAINGGIFEAIMTVTDPLEMEPRS